MCWWWLEERERRGGGRRGSRGRGDFVGDCVARESTPSPIAEKKRKRIKHKEK